MTRSVTVLICVACGEEAPHELVMVGRLFQSTRCTICGHVVEHGQRDLMVDYLRDLEHRLLTKPQRLGRRALREPARFVREFPAGLLRQPGKLIEEIKTLLRG